MHLASLRYRLDGYLTEINRPPLNVAAERVKLLLHIWQVPRSYLIPETSRLGPFRQIPRSSPYQITPWRLPPTSFPICYELLTNIPPYKQVGLPVDLCSGGARFESRPGYRLYDWAFRGFPQSLQENPGEYLD
jgi:hypothetical protein